MEKGIPHWGIMEITDQIINDLIAEVLAEKEWAALAASEAAHNAFLQETP